MSKPEIPRPTEGVIDYTLGGICIVCIALAPLSVIGIFAAMLAGCIECLFWSAFVAVLCWLLWAINERRTDRIWGPYQAQEQAKRDAYEYEMERSATLPIFHIAQEPMERMKP